eukprot:4841806-Prymnesium_polylepis.1
MADPEEMARCRASFMNAVKAVAQATSARAAPICSWQAWQTRKVARAGRVTMLLRMERSTRWLMVTACQCASRDEEWRR